MFYTECTLKFFFRVAFRYPRQQMVTEPIRALCMDRSCGGNELGTLRKHVFAGESTSQEYYGYVQGAYFTGRAKAEEIVSCIKGGKCEAYTSATEEI